MGGEAGEGGYIRRTSPWERRLARLLSLALLLSSRALVAPPVFRGRVDGVRPGATPEWDQRELFFGEVEAAEAVERAAAAAALASSRSLSAKACQWWWWGL